jgi:gamma-glutamyltranspeptidase/glutathione hydrolase
MNPTHWAGALTRVGVAAALACGFAACAHADGATIGVERSVKLPPQAQGQPPSWAGKAFRQGVVSVANPYGAEAGAKILEQGGNAIDAAVAIAYALNVVEPQSAGIGGGGFMMIHLAASGQTFAIDSREKAPAGATPRMFVGKSFGNASTSGIAVGVPGMVRGTALAVERWGQLPLAASLAPAIELASKGFAATPRYVSASCNARARNYPESEAYFCPGGTSRVAVGETVTNEPLAETLRTIARDGPGAFYSGDIAKGILEGQKRVRAGLDASFAGSMTLADLQAYTADLRAPVVGQYRGYTIKAMSPPSSGGLTVIQMLGMLERFPIGDASQGYGFGSTRTLHVMAEAMRLAFADRAVWMGDTDFVDDLPTSGLIDPRYVAMRSKLINPDARMATASAGDPRPYDTGPIGGKLDPTEVFAGPGGSTTHFSVVDKWGNMVSYTNTIESSHGAGMFAGYYPDGCAEVSCFRSFGFLLNNELTDFNFTPAANPDPAAFNPGANDVAPGKRPRSSMVPAMIFDRTGRPVVAYGSPGGSTIINSVFNVTLNLIDHGMTIQDAIDAPRLSVTGANGSAANVNIDNGAPRSRFTGFSQASLDGLQKLGHIVNSPADIGSVQAIVVDAQTGKQYGGADARREGKVIGLPQSLGGR